MMELFIPTLHTFAMNNLFTGSVRSLRWSWRLLRKWTSPKVLSGVSIGTVFFAMKKARWKGNGYSLLQKKAGLK